jgi:hypothetical protein
MAITIDEPHQSREDKIRERAHAIWLERHARGQAGTPESDWHIAELEIDQKKENTHGN